jgi:hypothetical protein
MIKPQPKKAAPKGDWWKRYAQSGHIDLPTSLSAWSRCMGQEGSISDSRSARARLKS